MSDKHRLGALQVRVAGHDGVAGRPCLVEKRTSPGSQAFDHVLNLLAHIEAQVGGNLLVAATAGVQFQTERTNSLD